MGRHFSQHDHNGHRDLQISILEFIRAPPLSLQGTLICTRVERNWTHLLRCLTPQGLNMENPKEFLSKQKWFTPPLPRDHNWSWHLSWSPTLIASILPTLTVPSWGASPPPSFLERGTGSLVETSLALAGHRFSHNRLFGLWHTSYLSHYLHLTHQFFNPWTNLSIRVHFLLVAFSHSPF